MRRRAYRARTLSGAQAEVRRLQNQIERERALLEEIIAERDLMARLAADEPQFFEPLEVAMERRNKQ